MVIQSRVFIIITSGLVLLLSLAERAEALSPCDFSPAESDLFQLSAQGAFQYYDDPRSDDRANAFTGNVEANLTQLNDTEFSGYRIDGNGKAEFSPGSSVAQLRAAGGFKRFVLGDRFLVGAADISGTLNLGQLLSSPMDIDLTGGFGIGRFRDVTPLAKAIRLQNTFLDQGILQGPLTDERLQQLAQIMDDAELTLAERIEGLERSIEETGLAAGQDLGAKALLQLEEIIVTEGDARLCGWELQGSVGVNLSELPRAQIHETFVLNWNYALVSDPVTQWTASARLDTGFDLLSSYSIRASLALVKRLAENIRFRGSLSFTRNPTRDPDTVAFMDWLQLSGTLFFQLTNRFSLSANGELTFETGYEDPSLQLALQLSYDIF